MGSEDRPIRRLFRLGLGRPAPDEAVEWEIEHYLEEQTERLLEEGWHAEEARAEAERRFGRRRYAPRMARMERRTRAMRTTTGWVDSVRAGVERTLRGVKRNPGFAVGVIATLGLGIGANVAMFGIIDRLLLRPPDHVVEHEQVRRVILHRGEWVGPALTYPDFMDLRQHDGLAGVAAFTGAAERTVGRGEGATRVQAASVSHEFFPLLGAAPVLGRTFTADEDAPGATPTVVLGHDYWERAWSSDPDVLGATMVLGGEVHTIIGVAPPGFTGVGLSRVDAWVPIETTQALETGGTDWKDGEWARSSWWMNAVVRVADGVGVEGAEAQATALHQAARRESIEADRYHRNPYVTLGPLMAARGDDPSEESRVAGWLGAVSFIVLLIACANVANLLLARAERRRREVAVRLALGVSRGRLVGEMVTETFTLALAGGALAIVLARWGGGLIRDSLLPNVHFPTNAMDGRVVGFALLASALAGLLAGLGPAIQSTRSNLSRDLREGGRGASGNRSPLRTALVVAQATFSLVLLVGAGLFVRSLDQVHRIDLGMDADQIVMVRLEMEGTGSGFGGVELERDRVNGLYEEAREVALRVPGAVAAAGTTTPFQWAWSQSLEVQGLDSIPRLPGGGPYYQYVTPDFFETTGLELRAGRSLLPSDGPGDARVVVVSETMATTLWPGESALGRCLLVGEEPEGCTEVVGVVEDASRGSLETEPHMAYYMPVAQGRGGIRALYVRAEDDVVGVTRRLATELRSFSPVVRFATAETLRDRLDPQARSWALGATMFTIFGLLALVVAAVGLYSVLSFEVAQRTREIGIRSALGAGRADLLRGVVVDGLRLVLAGSVLGLLAAWFLAPRMGDLLFEVDPRDPLILASVATALLLAALIAGLVPGLRATRVDPSTALRSE